MDLFFVLALDPIAGYVPSSGEVSGDLYRVCPLSTGDLPCEHLTEALGASKSLSLALTPMDAGTVVSPQSLRTGYDLGP